MFGRAKTESAKDAGSAGTGTEVPVRPRTPAGDGLQPARADRISVRDRSKGGNCDCLHRPDSVSLEHGSTGAAALVMAAAAVVGKRARRSRVDGGLLRLCARIGDRVSRFGAEVTERST